MRAFTVRQALEATGGRYFGPESALDARIIRVSSDSRDIGSGTLFVAFKGARVDGHSYMADCLNRGAVCCISEREPESAAEMPLIRVRSSLAAIGALAGWYRRGFNLPVVGITGSVGKTTTKEMISAVLERKFRVHKTEKNFNNELGVPRTLLSMPEDAQAARDLADQCERFEKKLYDLELTRNISLQMGPQIRLLQNNNTMMAEKIQSTIVNTIPLWKNQMVLALGLAHSQQAMQAERAVTNMTNDLLKKNAEALKMGTIETAKESQRGVVDIETLQQTNKSLIETLDELNKIQTEGRAKRVAAEQELTRIEDELKQKMMEIRS